MLTGASQGFCTKQKAEKILRKFTTLLYYDYKDAPSEIIQCAKLSAWAIGWPPCPATGTSGDCDKTWRDKGTREYTLHLGSDRLRQIVHGKTTVQLDLVNFMLCCQKIFVPSKFCHYDSWRFCRW